MQKRYDEYWLDSKQDKSHTYIWLDNFFQNKLVKPYKRLQSQGQDHVKNGLSM